MKYFRHAKNMSEMSTFHSAKIGAVAVLGNHILSVGFNQDKTHSVQKYYDRFRNFDKDNNLVQHKIHAEIACLYPIMNDDIPWHKVDLYIYRSRKDIPHGMARCCPACMELVKDLGIRKIYYSTDDGFAYEEINEKLA